MQAELDFFFLYKNTPHNSFFFLIVFWNYNGVFVPHIGVNRSKALQQAACC